MTKKELTDRIEHIVQRRLNLLNGEEFDLWLETKGFTNEIVDTIIDSLQEGTSFHCGDCIKWKDGKGCTLEAENTHCITDTACSKGVEKSKQEEPIDVATQIRFHNDAIKNLNSALNSMEHNGHLPKMMTAAESLGISEEEYAKIEDELFEEQEEPVSEELDDEVDKWLNNGLPNKEELIEHIKETARHFANWQKEKDNQIDKILEVNYAKGWDACKQQMMKDAIEAEVVAYQNGYALFANTIIDGMFYGDKVKLIIIKED